jgi:4-hydroxy-tetrahydrodipicolinate synthase
MTARLFGCGTALVTPFTAGGTLDEPALRALVEWQIAEGIHLLVPVGSTGEAVTQSHAERRRVVEIVVEQAAGRVPVMAGAGSNDTSEAIALSKLMRDAGATHLLHVTPMYNKPPQRALVEHFTRVAEATALPVCVYNVPGRTGVNLDARTTLTLAQVPNIVAVKEASANWGQMCAILADRPEHFAVLSGDDAFTLPLMAAGGDGVISVVSNATPRLMVQLVEAMRRGDLAAARALHFRLAPWFDAAFVESNPIPVKAALTMMGKVSNHLRLPLVQMERKHEDVVRAALRAAGALA